RELRHHHRAVVSRPRQLRGRRRVPRVLDRRHRPADVRRRHAGPHRRATGRRARRPAGAYRRRHREPRPHHAHPTGPGHPTGGPVAAGVTIRATVVDASGFVWRAEVGETSGSGEWEQLTGTLHPQYTDPLTPPVQLMALTFSEPLNRAPERSIQIDDITVTDA